MRLVIVGGSAHSTPQLFTGEGAGQAIHVTLAARSKENREAVARAIGLVSPSTPVECVGLAGDAFVACLAAADAVVVQFRVGGYDARTYDETFPLAFDICGDEGLGPGGLAAGWRTWPVLDDLLSTIERSGSKARVVLLTSPIGVLTRAALDAYPQLGVIGICELPFVTLGDVAAAANVALQDVAFSYAGVNHLGWFTSIESDGRDLLEAYTERPVESIFPRNDWMREYGVVPLKYLRLHYDRAALVAEQRAATPRGVELGRLQEAALASYAQGDRSAVETAIAKRSTPWYAYAVGPYLRALAGEDIGETILFLTGRNEGYLPWLAADEVVEIPYRCERGALVRQKSVERIPEPVKSVLDALVAYERAATAAVRARDVDAVAAALARHPWVSAPADAIPLARAVTSSSVNAFR